MDQEIENHDILYSEYEELAKEHEKLKSTKDKIMGKLSHSHLMAAVKEKKQEHEQQEKEIMAQFQDKSTDLEDYVEQFRKNREVINQYNVVLTKMA